MTLGQHAGRGATAVANGVRRVGSAIESTLAGSLEDFGERVPITGPIRYLTIPPYVLLSEVQLGLEEHAIALPTGERDWQLLSLPTLRRTRKIHSLALIEGTRHGSRTHQRIMADIYTYDGFVKVQESDVVVDTGAYVGGFSVYAAERADAVLAVEPNAKVSDVLSWNLDGKDPVTVVPKAGWKEPARLEINTSLHQFENSVLEPDDYETGESFEVVADTIPNIVREEGHEAIDFLKVEAEGVECEILKGALADGMEIERIAVDASPERNQDDTVDEVTRILESYDYECKTKDSSRWHWGEDIVFARIS